MISQAQAEAAAYDAEYRELASRPPGDTDLVAILPALHTLRTLRGGYEDRAASAPLTMKFGLWQGKKLSAAARDAYNRGLNGLFLHAAVGKGWKPRCRRTWTSPISCIRR